MRIFGIVLTVFVGLLALGWIATGNDFFLYQFFAPKYANVQRKVFEGTPSYNQGMIQELQNMQFQYEQADPAHKDALRAIILHRVAAYEDGDPYNDKLPADMRGFINQLKQGK